LNIQNIPGVPAAVYELLRRTFSKAWLSTGDVKDDAIDKTKIASDLAGSGLQQNADGSLELSTVSWTSFVPSWTNLTVGNGVNIGHYISYGKTCFFKASFTFGSSSSISGSVIMAFPLPLASYASNTTVGLVRFIDASPFAAINGIINSNGVLRVQDSSGSYLADVPISATAPITFTTGDIINIQGFAELA
jgi:hypothetical protein